MFARVMLYLVALSACGRVGFDAASRDGVTDAPLDAAPACAPGPWGPLVPQTALRSALNDWEATLHPGGLVLVFARQAMSNSDLWVATRPTKSADFGTPTAIPIAATPATFEYGPMWSPDGTELSYLFDDGAGGGGPRTLTHLGGTTFSSTFTVPDMPPGSFSWDITPDGLELFYTTVDVQTDFNLGHATRTSLTSAWVVDDAVAPLVRTGIGEGWPTYDAARETLLFEREEPTAVLTEARRPAPGAQFEIVGTTGVVADQDGDPDLSSDGLTLVFSSLRLGGGTGNDIFLTTRSCL